MCLDFRNTSAECSTCDLQHVYFHTHTHNRNRGIADSASFCGAASRITIKTTSRKSAVAREAGRNLLHIAEQLRSARVSDPDEVSDRQVSGTARRARQFCETLRSDLVRGQRPAHSTVTAQQRGSRPRRHTTRLHHREAVVSGPATFQVASGVSRRCVLRARGRVDEHVGSR